MRSDFDDPAFVAAVEWYVNPDRRYLELLHGNFLRLDEPARTTFTHKLAAAARQITLDELTLLLDGEWRCRLTAAVLAGIGRRLEVREPIGQLLLDSELTYAGQGYCTALATFATSHDADLLTQYLERYLPQTELRYDQDWAMAALQHVDTQLDTAYAQPFMAPNGAWEQWATALPWHTATVDHPRQVIEQLCAL
jgi:hypothetical protein